MRQNPRHGRAGSIRSVAALACMAFALSAVRFFTHSTRPVAHAHPRAIAADDEFVVHFAGSRDCQMEMVMPAPADQVFRLISDLDRYPELFPVVSRIELLDEGHYRWRLDDPSLPALTLDTSVRTTRRERTLCWGSRGRSVVCFRGRIVCRPVGHGCSRVEIKLSYTLPEHVFGQSVAELFGVDPDLAVEQTMHEYLTRVHWELLIQRHSGLEAVLSAASPGSRLRLRKTPRHSAEATGDFRGSEPVNRRADFRNRLIRCRARCATLRNVGPPPAVSRSDDSRPCR